MELLRHVAKEKFEEEIEAYQPFQDIYLSNKTDFSKYVFE